MTTQPIPMRSMDIVGLTDDLGDPSTGVQFAVVDPDGARYAYGDQGWVAVGDVLRLVHPDGKIQRRTITITYGEWEDQ